MRNAGAYGERGIPSGSGRNSRNSGGTPYSEDEIADGILKLCRDRALREKLSKDGI